MFLQFNRKVITLQLLFKIRLGYLKHSFQRSFKTFAYTEDDNVFMSWGVNAILGPDTERLLVIVGINTGSLHVYWFHSYKVLLNLCIENMFC